MSMLSCDQGVGLRGMGRELLTISLFRLLPPGLAGLCLRMFLACKTYNMLLRCLKQHSSLQLTSDLAAVGITSEVHT